MGSQKSTARMSYLSLHYHLIFSTKNRRPQISEAWQAGLWEYLGGTVKGLEGVPEAIGGVGDHVHLLVGLRATHRLADFLRELKKASSTWVHEEIGNRRFAWQDSYAAFTVSATARSRVRRYIGNQAEHHRKQDSREELIELLRRAGLAFDPQFLE